MQSPLPSRLRQVLLERYLGAGGWSYSIDGHQRATEPTALAVLACCGRPDDLVRRQNADGSWAPVHPGVSGALPGGWSTSLAVIALLRTRPSDSGILRALHWLCASRGIESHWLWRWKFKVADTQVAFDPGKYGWTWAPGMASWVIPTAFALLALRLGMEQGLVSSGVEDRLRVGREMLMDRACPDGGWNAGNSRVFGAALEPHIDATAIALLALQGTTGQNDGLLSGSFNQLLVRTRQCLGASSLAWSLLALHALRETPGLAGEITDRVAQLERLLHSPERIADNSTLAVSALALDAVTSDRNPFEVRR